MTRRHPDRSRRGTVLVVAALAMTALVMALALTLDAGLLFAEKRKAQAIADAAALAGAADLYKYYSTNSGWDKDGTAKANALAIAKENGYDDASADIAIVVRSYGENYYSGSSAGSAVPRGYIEVTVSYDHPRYFSSALGSGKINVLARAVAMGTWGIPKFGLLALDPTGVGLKLGGNGTANVTTGIIQVNSSDSGAVTNQSNATIIASELDIYGGMTGAGTITTSPVANNVNYSVPPAPDPLATLPAPSSSSLTSGVITHYKNINTKNLSATIKDTTLLTMVNSLIAKGVSVSNVYVLTPGIYGTTKTNTLSNFTNGDVVIFRQASYGNDGIYYLSSGGFTSNTATLQMYTADSGGIMFYNNGTSVNDKFTMAGGDSGYVELSGITSGTYQGMIFFQNRSGTEVVNITGNGTFNMLGTIYAPNAELSLTGQGSSSTIGSALIAKNVTLSGNGIINVTFSSGLVAPQRVLRLVD